MARTQQDVDREQERITDDNGDTVESALVGDDLELSYPTSEETIVDCARLDIPEEAVTALVGPNGSGKSTLLKALSKHLTPATGSVQIHGKDLDTFSRKELARAKWGVPRRRTTRSARSPSRTSSITAATRIGLFRRRHRGGSSGGRTCDRTGGDRPPPGVRTRPTERRSEATGLDRHGAGTGH